MASLEGSKTDIRPSLTAKHDQHSAAACEWFTQATWSEGQFLRFKALLDGPFDTATEQELAAIRLLARAGFYETWLKSIERMAKEKK